MVTNSEATKAMEVNGRFSDELTSTDRSTWDDILQNSRLPDYESSSYVQEEGDYTSDDDTEQESSVQLADSLSAKYDHDFENDKDSNCGEDDVAHSDIDHAGSIEYTEDDVPNAIRAHNCDDYDGVAITRADNDEFDGDESDSDDISECRFLEYVIGDSETDRDYDPEITKSVGHVADLVTIDDAGYESGTNENERDYLFKPSGEREAYDCWQFHLIYFFVIYILEMKNFDGRATRSVPKYNQID
uniref:Uncharacterized protein n=1 Tax=Peronospora matthiolae TaxID=2874970 RepID=A0AAV1TZV8_9STRA